MFINILKYVFSSKYYFLLDVIQFRRAIVATSLRHFFAVARRRTTFFSVVNKLRKECAHPTERSRDYKFILRCHNAPPMMAVSWPAAGKRSLTYRFWQRKVNSFDSDFRFFARPYAPSVRSERLELIIQHNMLFVSVFRPISSALATSQRCKCADKDILFW